LFCLQSYSARIPILVVRDLHLFVSRIYPRYHVALLHYEISPFRLVPIASLALGAVVSLHNVHIRQRNDDSIDGLDERLATAKRVDFVTLRRPMSCSSGTKNMKWSSDYLIHRLLEGS
jgi:hypothetical protein